MKLRNTIIIGTIIRICLMPFFAHPYDVYSWYKWCMDIVQKGPYTVVYTPMMFYTLIPIAYLYNWASTALSIKPIPMSEIPTELNVFLRYTSLYPERVFGSIPDILFNTMVKIPFIASDILATILLYKVVEGLTENNRKAETAAALWFLNPYLIFISSGWGMFDTLPTLFSIASLLLLIRKKIKLSAICLGIATAYKLYPAVFLVPLLYYFYKTDQNRESWKRDCLTFLSIYSATVILLFLQNIGLIWSLSRFLLMETERGPFAFGLTYWSISLAIPLDRGASTIISNIMVFASLAIVYWRTSKMTFKKPFINLTASMLACVLAVFLSYRIICEQYLVWALPFIIILSLEKRVEEVLHRSLSLTAIAYAITFTWIPYFLLATTPWIGNILIAMVRLVHPFRKPRPDPTAPFAPSLSPGPILYTILGTTFSTLTLILLTETLFKPRKQIMKKLLPNWLNETLRKLKIQTAD